MKPVLRLILLALLVGGCAALEIDFAPTRLEGVHWSLSSLGAERGPLEETQTEPYLIFGAEPNRVIGSDGCNRLTAIYQSSGDALELGPIASTRMACAQGLGTERGFGEALGATRKWAIADDRLEFYDANGAPLASFSGRRPD